MTNGNDFRQTYGPWTLVTGASSGIGEEFARQLASTGLNVALAARRKGLLDSLAEDLRRQFSIETRAVTVDLSDESAPAALEHAVADLDIGLVISNAGTGSPGRFLDENHEEQLERFRLNALSHLNIAYLFGRRLAQRGQGGLILGGALGAIDGIPFMATDAAAKALVQSLGESLHVELARQGIRVMTLVVPPTDTAIIQKFGLDPSTMPMKPMSTRQCVAEALQAFRKGRSASIPGVLNRTMNGLIPAFLKRSMMARMIERTLLPRPGPHPLSGS
jgi:short-subunit dehydrogenase